MSAIPPRAPGPAETAETRTARHFDLLREMAELGMAMARNAAAQALDPDPASPRPSPDPVLAFARTTTVVRQAITLEARIASGALAREGAAPARAPEPPKPGAAPDPRRAPLRHTLHKLAAAEPDRAARTRLCRRIDERIEHEILADPEADLPITDLLVAICDDLGLRLDPSKLPDELLGIPPQSPPGPRQRPGKRTRPC